MPDRQQHKSSNLMEAIIHAQNYRITDAIAIDISQCDKKYNFITVRFKENPEKNTKIQIVVFRTILRKEPIDVFRYSNNCCCEYIYFQITC